MNSTKSSDTKKQNSMELYLRREGIGSSAVRIPIASKKIKIGSFDRIHSARGLFWFSMFSRMRRATINGCSSREENFETALRDSDQKRQRLRNWL